MALDGIYLHLLGQEINDQFKNARVEKIYQPSKYEIILKLRTFSDTGSLLLSASGNNPRMCITNHLPENPAVPPMLCMLLRKHLVGAILTGIRQEGTDRIVYLDFDAITELGYKVKRTLILEIMAQYSNIILIDEDYKIIDSVKRVDLLKSSVRQILPGLKYELPPMQNKISILDGDTDTIVSLIKTSYVSSALLKTVEGISPLTSREITYRAIGEDKRAEELTKDEKLNLIKCLSDFQNNIKTRDYTPCILLENGQPKDFSFAKIQQYGDCITHKIYDDLSQVLDEFYFEKERLNRIRQRADDLFNTVNTHIERISRKINIQNAELEKAADREKKRIWAELINANLYRINSGDYHPGDEFFEVENYYDDCNSIRIPLKPELSPAQNANRYFKEYRKAQTAEKVLTEQIAQGKNDLKYLESVLDSLSRAETEQELSAVRDELIDVGFLRTRGTVKKQKSQTLKPIEYISEDGFRILVGRNNIQNDQLSFKIANKNDIWFHVQQHHGSHVILITDGKEPSDKTMEYAASLAVYHSSVRGSTNIPVDYTPAKNLKKVPGARLGFVIYHTYNTIIS